VEVGEGLEVGRDGRLSILVVAPTRKIVWRFVAGGEGGGVLLGGGRAFGRGPPYPLSPLRPALPAPCYGAQPPHIASTETTHPAATTRC
jgi:hypothetical protein